MTAAEFITAFPKFAEERVPDIDRHIAAAAPLFDVVRWANLYSLGLGNYVAHMLVVEKADLPKVGSTNALSKTVGSVSVTRSAQRLEAEAADPYQRTQWGRMYRYYARQVGMGAVAV